MKNEKFKTAFEKVKSYLASSLTADNTEEVTKISQELDVMNQAMEQEESDHLKTKDKLVDYVKSTSFKTDKLDDPVPDDSPKTMKEAEDIAMKELLKNRKNKKEKSE